MKYKIKVEPSDGDIQIVNARPILKHTFPELDLIIHKETHKGKYGYFVSERNTGFSVMPCWKEKGVKCGSVGYGEIHWAVHLAVGNIRKHGVQCVLDRIAKLPKLN